ncbi:MAG: DMT family transporter [Actinomycetota bacterium]
MAGETLGALEEEEPDSRAPGPQTLAAFLVMVAIAGGNAVAIRFSSCDSCELDAFWGAAFRFLLATAVCALLMLVLRVPLPRGRELQGAFLYGALTFGAGFGFIYWGLERSPASIGAVLLATGPLLTFIVAVLHRQESFRWDGLIGGLLAIAGSTVVVLSGLDLDVPLGSLLAIVAGALCWAEAAIVVKAYPRPHPLAMNAVGMGIGTVILLLLTVIFGSDYVMPENATTWKAIVYLVVLGSVVVFVLYLYVLKSWTASATSYEFVLIPIFGILYSAWLLDEEITVQFVVGSLLILLGVYFGAIRHRTVV